MNIWQFSENNIEPVNTITALSTDQKLTWIDAKPDEVLSTIELVEQLTGVHIHERHVKDCLNLQHPCFYESTHAYDIMVFRSLVSSYETNDTDTQPIDFLFFNNLLVTFHSHDHAIDRIKIRLSSTRKKMPGTPMALAFLLLDEIVDNFLELRSALQNQFNFWEQELFVDTDQKLDWLSFLAFKKAIRKLRVLSEDQQEIIYQWRQDNEMNLTEQSVIRFNDLSDHIHRIIRYAMQLESDLDTLIQLHYSLIGNRTNEVMRVLTVLSAIFLPLNLIAGIFGMNFTHMQLLHLPYGVDIALIGMAVLTLASFIIFKVKKWI